METPYPSIEFEAELDAEGRLALPKGLRSRIMPGKRITVTITEGTVSRSLRDRNITEHDVEHIAALQLEQREHVLRFLKAEGAFAGKTAFGKRYSTKKIKQT